MRELDIEINEIKNIKKAKVSIPLNRGIYGIIGNNGTGKSTIMTCLAQAVFLNSLDAVPSVLVFKFLQLGVMLPMKIYEEIQEWMQEKYGFHEIHLNIAKTKQKCGIIEQINYNFPKNENSKLPKMPKNSGTIIDAVEYFRMI